jgi:hypothetical protein
VKRTRRGIRLAARHRDVEPHLATLGELQAVGDVVAEDYIDKEWGIAEKLNKSIRENADHFHNRMPLDYSGYSGGIETALRFGLGS